MIDQQRQKIISFYSQFINIGDLCFDIGANIGNRTSAFIDLGAKVICVEPQPTCVEELRKRFVDNSYVTILETAVGEKEGYKELAICTNEPSISTMSINWRQKGRFSKAYTWDKIILVKITTLDNLIACYGLPMFCKIDVEGFETSVIKGLSSPIPFISFEFTREFFTDAKICMNHLLSIGSAIFNVSLGESMSLLLNNWVDAETLYKEIETINDPRLWGDIYVSFKN
ncbi:MAG: FkbM family methyltransferase [Nanoarchaeota archaeon]|nr:FkbM family methyltransferase [Nanoarchaeota archaeon]